MCHCVFPLENTFVSEEGQGAFEASLHSAKEITFIDSGMSFRLLHFYSVGVFWAFYDGLSVSSPSPRDFIMPAASFH